MIDDNEEGSFINVFLCVLATNGEPDGLRQN